MPPELPHSEPREEVREASAEAAPRILAPEAYMEKLREFGSEELAKTYEKVIEICEAVKVIRGRALLVGGSVRDMFAGQISKDFDLEVYGVEPEALEQLVRRFGKVSDVGKAFGILKISAGEGIDIDVSIPRRDSKTSEGHRGFKVEGDPSMSIEDAARRRDFSINSVAADPITGEVFDPFGGIKDLRQRRLRVTDPERFRDDPLRVLRGLQFIARFGLELEPESASVMREMIPQLKELPKERLLEEWKKLLMKAKKPSLGMAAGMTLGVFHELHPELPALVGVQQEPEWHPEGDVWVHTLMVVDKAAEIVRREQLDADSAWMVMLASLAHDYGKPQQTKFDIPKDTQLDAFIEPEGRWKSHGHEGAGEEPTKKFLATLGVDALTRDKVVKLVVDHLAPGMLYVSEVVKGKKISDGAIRRLAARIHPATIQELVMVAEADHTGRGPFADKEIPEQLLLPDGFPAGRWLLDRARATNVEKSKPVPLIQGRELVQLGFKRGTHIGRLMALANELRDEKNFSAAMVFAAIDEIKDPAAAIEKLESLLK